MLGARRVQRQHAPPQRHIHAPNRPHMQSVSCCFVVIRLSNTREPPGVIGPWTDGVNLLALPNKWQAMRTIAGHSSWPPSNNCSLNRRQKLRHEKQTTQGTRVANYEYLSIGYHQPHTDTHTHTAAAQGYIGKLKL